VIAIINTPNMILKRSLSSGFSCFILSLILLFSSDQIQAQNKTKDFKISVAMAAGSE
jgi:hypothetical protein